MRRGYTLLEMALVVLLMAMSGLALLPIARRLRDRMAVVGARETVAGLFARARTSALLFGGATVHIRRRPWRAWAEAGDSVLERVDLEREYSVSVLVGRGRDSSDVRYDGLGLGRVASVTLTFSRGTARAALVVSSYGRVRRR